MDKSNYGSKFEVYRSKVNTKVKVTGNENVEIVFRAYLCLKWIDLRRTKTKVINTYSLSLDTFHQWKCFVVCDNL